MHAFLIIGSEDITSFTEKPYSRVIIYPVSTIGEVRELIHALRFTPSEATLFHLTGIDTAKAEAQNALLKLLEEPSGDGTLFVLTAIRESGILPTILSRVHVIKTKQMKPPQNISSEASGVNFATLLSQIGKITDREAAIEFLDMATQNPHESATFREAAEQARVALKKNGAVALCLTDFALQALK